MGVYGVDYYAVARFGRDPNLSRPDFSVAPFKSTPLDYATLHLTWVKPVSTDCVLLQLTRNMYNTAQDVTDGTQLFGTDGLPVNTSATFTDDTATPGFNYYTMWGWDQTQSTWVRCTDLIALLPLPWNYGNRLYNLLPLAYRDIDAILVDPYNPWMQTDNGQLPPLQRYLNLIGFQLDYIRSELESLLSVNDPLRVSGALLPLLAYQFGLPNDPEIGMQQERQLVSNVMHLYKLKGSGRGVTEFCSLSTGYPSAVMAHKGYNLMLSLDDSIMADSIGTWQKWPPPGTGFPATAGENVNVQLIWYPNLLNGAITGMTNPASLIGFEPGPTTGYSYPYANSGMQIKMSTTGTYTADICTGAIPTTDFLSATGGPGNVTFQIQIWSPAARTFDITLWGDAGNKTPIQIGGTVSGITTLNNWKQFTLTAAVDPTRYFWIYPRVRLYGAAEAHYITFAMVWACTPDQIGQEVPIYDYPRDVKIVLAPQRTNMLANPLTTFTYGFDGWTSASDPTQPDQDDTASLYVHYQTVDDPTGLFAVNGYASLQISSTQPNAVVWAGTVNTFSPPIPLPTGWFFDPFNNVPPQVQWFNQGAPVGPPRLWFDPDLGWNTMSGSYYHLPSGIGPGDWFTQPQPPQTGNMLSLQAFPGQMMNFSVYARYMTADDPTAAFMQIGMRWYFPDDTFTEDYVQVQLTQDWQRYSFPPNNQSARSLPPVQKGTGLYAISVYPFVRFPNSQSATFLLNSAMLSPGDSTNGPPAFLDCNLPQFQHQADYVLAANGASYYYRGKTQKTFRLRQELYRWLPIGSTYSLQFAAANVLPPLDPTLWP